MLQLNKTSHCLLFILFMQKVLAGWSTCSFFTFTRHDCHRQAA